MLLACFTFFLWVPRVRSIVLPSFKEDFVSITSAFVCSVSLEDDGIRPSTFSLPHLPFTPQCSWPQESNKTTGNLKSGSEWHENEQGQSSVLHWWHNSASNWIRKNIQVDFSIQHLRSQSKACCLCYLFPICSCYSLWSARITALHLWAYFQSSFFAFYFIWVTYSDIQNIKKCFEETICLNWAYRLRW